MESSFNGKMKKTCICSFTTARIIKHTGVKPCQQFSGNIYNATMKENFCHLIWTKKVYVYSHYIFKTLTGAKALHT